ncbi:MAG: helix-turn-helix transcriptional regulator [Rhodocyclales bacterium]|nr:helix-turn-helix transcriptional regulator [Rhodocyclales bacterium]
MKAARQQAKLSQESLALAAEVDRTYVSQLERGIANPSLLILYRLAKTLGLELKISFISAPEGGLPS